MFIVDPNATPFESMLNKLLAAGWIEGYGTIRVDDLKDANQSMGQIGQLNWTAKAKNEAKNLLGIIEQIEAASMPLTGPEFSFLLRFAKVAANSPGQFGAR